MSERERFRREPPLFELKIKPESTEIERGQAIVRMIKEKIGDKKIITHFFDADHETYKIETDALLNDEVHFLSGELMRGYSTMELDNFDAPVLVIYDADKMELLDEKTCCYRVKSANQKEAILLLLKLTLDN